MISNNPAISKIDLDAQRRHALVKVYKLLIRLADEAKNKSDTPEVAEEKNKGESTVSPMNASADQVNSVASQ